MNKFFNRDPVVRSGSVVWIDPDLFADTTHRQDFLVEINLTGQLSFFQTAVYAINHFFGFTRFEQVIVRMISLSINGRVHVTVSGQNDNHGFGIQIFGFL